MEKDSVFCINCQGIFPYYTVESVKKDILSDGREIEYNVTLAYCSECGEEVYVNKLVDESINARWAALFNAFKK